MFELKQYSMSIVNAAKSKNIVISSNFDLFYDFQMLYSITFFIISELVHIFDDHTWRDRVYISFILVLEIIQTVGVFKEKPKWLLPSLIANGIEIIYKLLWPLYDLITQRFITMNYILDYIGHYFDLGISTYIFIMYYSWYKRFEYKMSDTANPKTDNSNKQPVPNTSFNLRVSAWLLITILLGILPLFTPKFAGEFLVKYQIKSHHLVFGFICWTIELYLWIIAYPVYKDVMEHIQKCPSQSKAEPKPDLEPQCQV